MLTCSHALRLRFMFLLVWNDASELKDKFWLCYRVSTQCTGFCRTLTIDSKDIGDKKRNVPCSGLYKTRLNQKGANLLWYQNKRDEGVMFEKYFTPFPIPALAFLYTVVSHACSILLFGSLLRSYSKDIRSEGLQPQLVCCAPFLSIAPYFRTLYLSYPKIRMAIVAYPKVWTTIIWYPDVETSIVFLSEDKE